MFKLIKNLYKLSKQESFISDQEKRLFIYEEKANKIESMSDGLQKKMDELVIICKDLKSVEKSFNEKIKTMQSDYKESLKTNIKIEENITRYTKQLDNKFEEFDDSVKKYASEFNNIIKNCSDEAKTIGKSIDELTDKVSELQR